MITQEQLNKYLKKLTNFIVNPNIATDLDKDELAKIGELVVTEYEMDKKTTTAWWEQVEKATKLAKQIIEEKSRPWSGAANVKYPILTNACIQFNARTFPEVVKGDRIVKTEVLMDDPDGSLGKSANRIATHMSYQLLEEVPNWQEDTDRLFMLMPMFGIIYRKIYYDTLLQRPVIDLCLPNEIVINNNVKSLVDADRITHIVELTDNQIFERVNGEIFLEIEPEELDDSGMQISTMLPDINQPMVDNNDSDKRKIFLEQYRLLDLDKDGYKEPYIVTVHLATRKVVRIVANYDLDTITIDNGNGKLLKIDPVPHFVDYPFIPNIDGTYHALGFAHILYPINKTVNSAINQLLDAGTLANSGGGLINRGLRLRKGVIKQELNVYQDIDVPLGTNLSQNVMPWPVTPPSSVLFQLLGMMIQAAKEISSVSDVMSGQEQAQNVPATTILALIEQGTKVYSSIQKRIYNSLRKEFNILYYINRKYLNEAESFGMHDKEGQILRQDYEMPFIAIRPVADPNMSSDSQRLTKIQALMNLLQYSEIDRRAVLAMYIDSLQVPNAKAILPPPDPNASPSPDVLKTQAEIRRIEMESANILMTHELQAMKLQLDYHQTLINAAVGAGQVAQMKMSSILQYAEAEVNIANALNAHALAELQQTQSILSQVSGDVSNAANQLTTNVPPAQQFPSPDITPSPFETLGQQPNQQQGQPQGPDQGAMSPDQGGVPPGMGQPDAGRVPPSSGELEGVPSPQDLSQGLNRGPTAAALQQLTSKPEGEV